MAPNTEVIIEIPCERKVPEVKKEKFTVTQEKPSEKTPLLGKKKEAKENDLTALSIVKKLDPAIVSLFIFLVVGTSVGLYLLCHEDREPLNFQIPLCLIERSDVLSSPPYQFFPVQTLSELIVTGGDESPNCKTRDQCLNVIKTRGLPYNFFVGGDGNVYEVLGWDFLSTILESQNRDKAFIIGFSGDFSMENPPVNCLGLVKAFASEAIRRKRLVSDYKVYGMKNVSRTTTTGDTSEALLFKDLHVWPQWSGIIETV